MGLARPIVPGTAARSAARLLVLAAAVLAAPAVASAQDYDMNFTLPTAGKSGCMVCHADENLIRLKEGRFLTYWVDPEMLDASAHVTIMCTGCHIDFAFKAPHNIKQTDWRATAKLACKNCHDEQFQSFGTGVHSMTVRPGEQVDPAAPEKPLCGDCHGAHAIEPLTDNPAGRASLHRHGWEVCGRCHPEEWDNYADYYHGAAYRRGAPDAPACWDCHGAHDIQPSADRRSMTNESNLEETCGKCHDGVNAEYVSYAGLVHRKGEVLASNPVYSFLRQTREAVTGLFGSLKALFV
ncbi:MAG: hypothetical protein IBX62_04530 [Coriobacteriia bacterium]|nr:hypothetical protein [Coriobacteriia bacterium]